MTPVTVRRARSGDTQAIRGHLKCVLSESGVLIPFTQDEVEIPHLYEILESHNSNVLLAEAEGQIVGILECKGSKNKAMRHVTSLSMSVCKELRNRRIGSALLANAITWARASGTVKRIELFVYPSNTAAVHLYQKFGFEEEGRCRRAIFQNGEYLDDLIMALLL